MAPPEQILRSIQAEALRIEEDALYSARGHWEASKPWGYMNLCIGVPLTILAAAGGFYSMSDYPKVATTIAFLVSTGAGLATFLAPSQRHQRHADCGNAYKAVSNQARIFRLIESELDRPADELLEKLKKLDDTRNALNASSPIIPRRAFEAARKGIEAGEAAYLADRGTSKS